MRVVSGTANRLAGVEAAEVVTHEATLFDGECSQLYNLSGGVSKVVAGRYLDTPLDYGMAAGAQG
jgi:hypothetical protein